MTVRGSLVLLILKGRESNLLSKKKQETGFQSYLLKSKQSRKPNNMKMFWPCQAYFLAFFLKGDEQDYFPLPCRSGWSRLREQTFPSAQVTWPQCTKPVREEESCPQQAIPPTLSSPWLSRQTNRKNTGSGGAWRSYVSWAHKPLTSHGDTGAFPHCLERIDVAPEIPLKRGIKMSVFTMLHWCLSWDLQSNTKP